MKYLWGMFTANPLNNIIPGDYYGFPYGTKEQTEGFNPPEIEPINGKVTMVGHGASVPNQIFNAFIKANTSTRVRLTNICDPAKTLEDWLVPNSQIWAQAMNKVANPSEVQVIWCMHDRHSYPDNSFPATAFLFRDNMVSLFEIYKEKFPNVKLILMSSRPYAGYVTNPNQTPYKEPSAYHNGFGVKFAAEIGIEGVVVLDGNYIWSPETPENHNKPGDVHLSSIGSKFLGAALVNYMKKFTFY